MAFVEDFTPFFDVEVGFAVSASWAAAGGSDAVVGEGIFDANGAVLDAFDAVVEGPSLLIPTEQWAAAAEGDALAIGASNYLLRQVIVLADGGLKRLVLVEA